MNAEEVEALVGQLRDFRMRKEAGRRLIAMGPAAVGPLVEALERDGYESARWTILNCLGELDADDAVPVVARYLEMSDFQSVAHDALVRITGHDLGVVREDWLRWLAEHGKAPAAQGELPDERLVELALEGAGAEWRARGQGRYLLDLPVAEGRRRQVTVLFGVTDHEGSPVVVVFSTCGEARPEHYETALRNNLRMPYGAVALRDVDGRPHFVMFNTVLRQGLSPTELRKSIMTVGERGERTEKELAN